MIQPACEKNKGYIALIGVLLIGVVAAATVISLIVMGINSLQTASALERANQAKALANACAEEALQQIRDATAFAGSFSLTFSQGVCSYQVTNNGGQNRQINILASAGTAQRNIVIAISQINPQIVITSWQELSDF